MLGSGRHENSGPGWLSWQLNETCCCDQLRPRIPLDHGVSCPNVNFLRAHSSDVHELTRRVAQLEDALPQPVASDAPSDTASPSLATSSGRTAASRSPATDHITPQIVYSPVTTPCHVVTSPGSLHSAAKYLGPHWFFNGVPIFSDEGQRWVSLQTGQQVRWSEFRIPIYRPTSLSVLHLNEPDTGLLDLIDQSTAKRILEPFFSLYAPRVFPVIDPVLFETTLDTAYEILDDPLSSPTHIAARACVLGALSIAGRVKTPSPSPSPPDPERSAIKAQRLLSLIPGSMSLDTLITVLIFASHPICSSCQDSCSERPLILGSKANALQFEW